MRAVYRIFLLIAALTGVFVLWWSRTEHRVGVVDVLFPNGDASRQPGVVFAVIGDNEGENPAYNDLITQIADDPSIQFVLHVGDATPTGSEAELQALKELHRRLGLSIPVYMVPGNHDIKDANWQAAWEKSEGKPWRSIDIGALHLVLLENANRKIGFPSTELDWLENDLRNRLAGQITVVAYHRPFNYPLANILGDDETRASRISNERFVNILAQYPVDYIFNGHVHTAIDYTMALERDANDRITKSVPVTVSGGGGQPIQTAFGGLLKEKFHALRVEVAGKNISTTFILQRE